MRTTQLALALLALAALVSLALWLDEGAASLPAPEALPLAETSTPRRPLPGDRPTVPREPLEPVALRPPAPDATLEASPAEARLRVTVIQREGRSPVTDVVVVATLDDGENSKVDLRTDGDGVAGFTFGHEVIVRSIEVHPGPRSTRLLEYVSRTVRPGSVREVILELPTPATVSGVVLGPGGTPVAGAEVLGWCRRRPRFGRADGDDTPARVVTADNQGRFSMEAVGPEFSLSARAPGMVCRWRARGEVPPGAVVDGIVLELEPALELTGRLVGEDGRPVAGAEVVGQSGQTSWSSDGSFDTAIEGVSRAGPVSVSAISTADGRFVLSPVCARPYHLVVEHEPWLPYARDHRADESPLEIRLERGVGLGGTVRNAAGAPVAGARVKLRISPDGVLGMGRRTATDAQGRFFFDGLLSAEGGDESASDGLGSALRSLFGPADDPPEPAETALMVAAAGHAIGVVQPVTIPADGSGHVDVWLEPAQPLAGRVIDEQGAPVPDARVSVQGDRLVRYEHVSFGRPTTWEWALGVDTTITDGQGRFRFPMLYDGAFEVRVRDPGEDLTVVMQTRSGREDLLVQLDRESMRRVALSGRVTDALTGQAIERLSVTPMYLDETGLSGQVHDVHDPEGRFELVGLDPGQIELSIKAPGYAPWSAPLAPYDVGEHAFDVALLPARSLQLRLVDEQRAPVAGVQLTFRDARDEPLMVVQGPMTSDNARTGADGEVEVHALPAGPVHVHAMTQEAIVGLVPEVRRSFDLTVPLEGLQEITVPDAPGRRRVGLIVLCSATPHADEPLVANPEGEAPWQRALADGTRSLLDVELQARVLHDGVEISSGSCRPVEGGGYAFESVSGLTSSTGHAPVPVLDFNVWQVPLQIECSAPGYATRTVDVEAGEEVLRLIVTLVNSP